MEHTGKRALVLAGGGAKGSYQIGVWHALQALDWTPDIITGASVGTLNGCLFTMGKAREAEELWHPQRRLCTAAESRPYHYGRGAGAYLSE